jgi:hypothetical protein
VGGSKGAMSRNDQSMELGALQLIVWSLFSSRASLGSVELLHRQGWSGPDSSTTLKDQSDLFSSF